MQGDGSRWFYILYEIFAGEACQVAASNNRVDETVRSSEAIAGFVLDVRG